MRRRTEALPRTTARCQLATCADAIGQILRARLPLPAAGAFGFPQLSALAMRLDNQFWAGTPASRDDVQALVDALSAM